MTDQAPEIRIVVVERDLGHAPDKIWRALTQPHLIQDWLMKNDFAPVLGHRFKLTADWGAVECQVKAIDPGRVLSYSWDALGLESVVTWTLEPSDRGTLLRMAQSGFRADQTKAFMGAKVGWQRFLDSLERVLDGVSGAQS